MAKQEKIERVTQLRGRIEGSDALLLTEYRGLAVADITELRRSLSDGGARLVVVKNTLMRRAANETALAELEPYLEGPTAVAFVAGDPVAAARKVVDAQKRFPTLVLKGGYMEGRVLSAEEARALADLDSREGMLSKVAGMMKSEMSRAASMFQSLQSQFLGLLEAFQEKVPAPAAEAPVAQEPAAAEPAAEEPTAEEPTSEGAGENAESEARTEAPASGEDEKE